MNLIQKAEDIIMKNVFDLLKGDALKFFGIDDKIVAPARTEFNFVELQTNFSDNTYLLEDGSLIHIEFQTTKEKSDMYRFMVSDAVMFYKERKPIRTIVIYSADITDVVTSIDIGSITYKVDAFYMVAFDGDVIYNNIVKKINNHEKLSKQDLMSIVLLPIMKSKDDKLTRIKNCIELSKNIEDKNELIQVQAMIYLMAEKFVDEIDLEKVKEMISMMPIMESILSEKLNERDIEIAERLIRRGLAIEAISEDTGLDESTIIKLQKKMTTAH